MTTPAAAFQEVTGAILTGGQSRRLGRDKVLLPYKGKPLALHLYQIFGDLFPHIIFVGHPRPELEALGLDCVPDLVPGQGVLGGIHTALKAAKTPYVFIAGADMPFLSASLISGILQQRQSADAVIPMGPRGMEPLCAVYAISCADNFGLSLEKGVRRIMEALEGLKVITPAITPKEGEQDPFVNINRPEDLEILQKADN